MATTLGELAVRFGLELAGDPATQVSGVATLASAGPGTLTFLANPRYRRLLAGTRASAVVLDAGAAADCPVAALVAANPYAAFARIVELFHRHEVAYLRDQRITPEQHVAFSRRMGELEVHVRQDCLRPGFPELFVVSNIIEDGRPIGSQDAGQFWHSDLCYLHEPSRASVFYALEVPQKDGKALGDTMFASLYSAWDTLDPALQGRIRALRVLHP